MLKEVAVTQVHIIRTKNKVLKQRDLTSTTLCMDSAGYKIETCSASLQYACMQKESVKLVLKF